MYGMKKVSELTGIPAVTIRAWENRYGALDPERTGKGQRLYTEEDVKDLLWLKEQTERGIAISQAVRLLKEGRRVPEAEPRLSAEAAEWKPVEPEPNQEPVQRLLYKRIYQELKDYRSEAANGLLEHGLSLFSIQEVCHQILGPLMHRAGDDWEQGLLSVAQEHFISSFVLQRYSAFLRMFPVNPALPRFVALCPSGEHHQVGLLLFSLFLRQYGAEVIYLGADTPADGLGELIRERDIWFVCMSITLTENRENAVALIRELHAKRPGLRFLLGGKGFGEAAPEPYCRLMEMDYSDWKQWFEREITGWKGAGRG